LLHAVPLPPGAVEKILGGNAAGLLGLNSQASSAIIGGAAWLQGRFAGHGALDAVQCAFMALTAGRHPSISTTPPAANSSSGSQRPAKSGLICNYQQQRQVFFLTPEIASI